MATGTDHCLPYFQPTGACSSPTGVENLLNFCSSLTLTVDLATCPETWCSVWGAKENLAGRWTKTQRPDLSVRHKGPIGWSTLPAHPWNACCWTHKPKILTALKGQRCWIISLQLQPKEHLGSLPPGYSAMDVVLCPDISVSVGVTCACFYKIRPRLWLSVVERVKYEDVGGVDSLSPWSFERASCGGTGCWNWPLHS